MKWNFLGPPICMLILWVYLVDRELLILMLEVGLFSLALQDHFCARRCGAGRESATGTSIQGVLGQITLSALPSFAHAYYGNVGAERILDTAELRRGVTAMSSPAQYPCTAARPNGNNLRRLVQPYRYLLWHTSQVW